MSAWSNVSKNEERNNTLLWYAENHTIVDVNRFAAEMIVAAGSGIIGHVCHGLICPVPTGQCLIRHLGQNVSGSEHVLLAAEGKKLRVLKTVIPIVLSGREYLLESFVQVANREQVGEKLQENAEQLSGANRLCVERELEVTKLKRKVNALFLELGREEQYEGLSAEGFMAISK